MNSRTLALFFALACCQVRLGRGQSLEWVRQMGTSQSENAGGISTDGLGNVFVSGQTRGNLGGVSVGNYDAFLSKYGADGTLAWTRQWGTSEQDENAHVSADRLGNIYVAGHTEGSLGGPHAGERDVFVSKFDTHGTLAWTRQWGTSAYEGTRDIATDGLGNVYIAGIVFTLDPAVDGDAFIAKYDCDGALAWTRQWGVSQYDYAMGVYADPLGNVYVAGHTEGNLGGVNAGNSDAYLRKYDADGTLAWTQQWGTDNRDIVSGVSADDLGNVYVSGTTRGNFGSVNAGDDDAFVSKLDANGTLLWTQQWGTSEHDDTSGVAVDAAGSIYVSVDTVGVLGNVSAGEYDAAVSKLDANGTLAWTQQLGTSVNEYTQGIAASGLGVVYLSGYTYGNLAGGSPGGAGGFNDTDRFLVKFVDDGVDVDFNNDGVINCADIDGLVAQIVAGNHSSDFDLNGDGLVDAADLDRWLESAGAANLPSGNPYLPGDANLDGAVDASDFNIWNSNRFSQTAAWCAGDFNADGAIDASDFNIWNSHRFMSSDGLAVVPEPGAIWLAVIALGWLGRRRVRR